MAARVHFLEVFRLDGRSQEVRVAPEAGDAEAGEDAPAATWSNGVVDRVVEESRGDLACRDALE